MRIPCGNFFLLGVIQMCKHKPFSLAVHFLLGDIVNQRRLIQSKMKKQVNYTHTIFLMLLTHIHRWIERVKFLKVTAQTLKPILCI